MTILLLLKLNSKEFLFCNFVKFQKIRILKCERGKGPSPERTELWKLLNGNTEKRIPTQRGITQPLLTKLTESVIM